MQPADARLERRRHVAAIGPARLNRPEMRRILTRLLRKYSDDAEDLIMAEGQKLVGQDCTTPDLVARVTGKAKYAEDFRAEGMLFAKLLYKSLTANV